MLCSPHESRVQDGGLHSLLEGKTDRHRQSQPGGTLS